MEMEVDYTLGVESSWKVTELAVIENNELLREVHSDEELMHTESINLLFERLMKELRVEDITLVAVSIGPGFFTSLRVGVSFAKAVSFSLGIPVTGVNTLDALVEEIKESTYEYIVPTIDAQRRGVYAAVYKNKAGFYEKVSDYLVIQPEELKRNCKKALFIGNGVLRYPAILTPSPPGNPLSPRAQTIARMGKLKLREANREPSSIEPFYIKTPPVEE